PRDHHSFPTRRSSDLPFTVVADGEEAILRSVREELRRGASHIKIMLSGSVVSPHASVNRSEYSDGEIRTIVEEVERAGKYVTAQDRKSTRLNSSHRTI